MSDEEPEQIVIGRETFIRGPYESCPACGAKDGLGLLSVYHRRYAKRCRECLHDEVRDLPDLDKKVIYLDQHAVSHLAKALHPDSREKYKPGNPATQDGFWREAFAKLDRLHMLQLAVCPESTVHRTESLLNSRLTESLKTLYEHLAGEVQFHSPDEIKSGQIIRAFGAQLQGEPPTYGDAREVLRGRLNAWLDTLRIGVDMGWTETERKEARRLRDRRNRQMQTFHDAIAGEGDGRDYDGYFERETTGAEGFLHSYTMRIMLTRCLERNSVPRIEWSEGIATFAASNELRAIPVLQIWAALLAAYAVEISTGRGARPTPGLYFDLIGISSFLPYCDAFFVDRECKRWLDEAQSQGKIDWPTRVFTIDRSAEFLEYLEEIESDAPAEHHDLVETVYGADRLKPFWELYEWRDE
jgi:hypothetical protein